MSLFCVELFGFRYGPIFKTSLVGRPIVVSTDHELNNFVFQQEGKLFQSWYPDTFTEIFGRDNVGSLHGFIYKYLKNLVLKLFGPESLKEKLLHDLEKSTCRSLSSWSHQSSIELKDGISTVCYLELSILLLFDSFFPPVVANYFI